MMAKPRRAFRRFCRVRRAPSAFTLVELLAVLALISLLVALLLPTAASARAAALKAQSRTRFVQWATAMELFRQEYGHYPAIATDGRVDPAKLAPALLGRRNLIGDPLADDAPVATLAGNLRRLTFLSLSLDDLTVDRTGLVDAFGNREICVRIDLNNDGRIGAEDGGAGYRSDWPAVFGAEGRSFSPVELDATLAEQPLPARVIFYSAGRGRTAADLVLSW